MNFRQWIIKSRYQTQILFAHLCLCAFALKTIADVTGPDLTQRRKDTKAQRKEVPKDWPHQASGDNLQLFAYAALLQLRTSESSAYSVVSDSFLQSTSVERRPKPWRSSIVVSTSALQSDLA